MLKHIEMFPSAKTLMARAKPRYKYTIKDTDGTIHTFKTLKEAKQSRIGFDDLSPITGGMRIIARVKIEPKTLNMRYWGGGV